MSNIYKNKWVEMYLHPLLPSLKNTKTAKNIIFLRGISGSGKTTNSESLSYLLGSESVVTFSADNYFTTDGVYRFDIEKASEAHQDCVRMMELALRSSAYRYIIMDNTHAQLWHMHKAENIANKYDTTIFYIDIVVPDEAHFLLCLKRQRHNVPEDVLLHQWQNWELNSKSIVIPMFVSEEEKAILSKVDDNKEYKYKY